MANADYGPTTWPENERMLLPSPALLGQEVALNAFPFIYLDSAAAVTVDGDDGDYNGDEEVPGVGEVAQLIRSHGTFSHSPPPTLFVFLLYSSFCVGQALGPATQSESC